MFVLVGVLIASGVVLITEGVRVPDERVSAVVAGVTLFVTAWLLQLACAT